MMSSGQIVLARSSPDDPFRYAVTRSVKGETVDADIPFLVDSGTRRRLALSLEDGVLFARPDPAGGGWTRLLYSDADMKPVLDHIMTRIADWETGNDNDRFAFFAGLLAHANPAVHALALRELDQASYGQLRASVKTVDVDRLLDRLDLKAEYQLKPIRILLLGLSKDPRASERIAAGLAAQLKTGGSSLGAFATASIELNGPGSIAALAQSALADPDASAETRESVVEALALNGVHGDADMRAAVHDVLHETVRANPELAPAVARQFGSRNDWSFSELFMELMSHKTESVAEALALYRYVALANGMDQNRPRFGRSIDSN